MTLAEELEEELDERAFNAAAGFTKAHDRLPLYFSRESVAPHNVRWDVSDEDLDSVFNF